MSAKERILLVDDDVDFVNSTKDLLEAYGYQVISAHDGASGLALARQERPDLMVLDVMMATKTEGFEVARRIPSCPELRDMPVLLVTGIRSEMKLGFRLEPNETWLPVSRIMEKPIEPAVFVGTIAELLRRRAEMDMKHSARLLVKRILAEKSPNLWTVRPESTVLDAVRMMEKYGIGSVLVVDAGEGGGEEGGDGGAENKLLGICTERDCARSVVLEDRPPKSTLVREIMTAPVICIAPDDTTEECMSLMTHKRIRHLPVMDGGKLIGIISMGDIIRAALADKNFMIEQLENYITTG